MKEVYGYIRVSTAKQGEKGVSLIEQKDAIERYSSRNNLIISEWFEERETAAKRGRTIFTDMILRLKSGMAAGVVIHKIDRSARNLRDWADLVDLADQGIEIHFVNESIDMGVRGGRLSADIQAVVAADYIRNLREETIKGLRGRLKQGFYPWAAPVGYLDKGGGKAKEIDPLKGPMVRDIFELYATGKYPLKALLKIAHSRGVTNKNGKGLSKSGLAAILHNSFYYGVIHVRSMDESFVGQHEPLINQALYAKVQRILQGKNVQGNGKHAYTFRRLFSCSSCNCSLIGERQKGHVYYRCHNCPGVCVREEAIEATIAEILAPLELCEHEVAEVEEIRNQVQVRSSEAIDVEQKAVQFELDSAESRLDKLTDVFVDGAIDKDTFLRRKNDLVRKIQMIRQRVMDCGRGISQKQKEIVKYLELYKTAYLGYKTADSEGKRDLLVELTSNRLIQLKNVVIELLSPFRELAEAKKMAYCAHCRATSRTGGNVPGRKHVSEVMEEWVDAGTPRPDQSP